ncbi:MAG: hypothetical protein FWG03_01935 [Clostridiales bacterium]|nr:hypothetical protein [Clostridiales bacterium]
MNNQTKGKKKWSAKLVSLLMAAVFVASAFVVNLGNTLAAPNDIDIQLECESGIIAAYTVEKGQTKTMSATSLNEAFSAMPDVATVSFTPGNGLDNIRTTGVKAGVTAVAYGNRNGKVSTILYQVTDNANISAYTIRDKGEVYFTKEGVTKETPVVVTAGSQDRIEWRSTNTAVATVAAGSGAITSQGKGAAIIIGSFIDKWGVARDIHLLVSVGAVLGDSDLGRLLELIKEGEFILSHDGDKYTADSLNDLEEAVNGGIDVVNTDRPTAGAIADAIKDLEDALSGLVEKPVTTPELIGPDDEGNWYRPVGDPPNVYEVVDEDGNGSVPPKYVYNEDGLPAQKPEKNKPAHKYNGQYYIEYPENIWHRVKGDGTVDDSPALWGGPDGKPGGGDDEKVYLFDDGNYWVDMGQNVWREVDKDNPTGELGPLTGGGPDGDPSTDPVTEIFDNTANDGKYYVGPVGTEDGFEYFYGDPEDGNGTLDSTIDGIEKDDVKYYRDEDGNMTVTKPIMVTVVDGRELTKDQTGDSYGWVEIARYGEYSLILRGQFINVNPNNLNVPEFQASLFGATGDYAKSGLRNQINSWFSGTGSAPQKLPADARLRDFTVKNTALGSIGAGPGPDGFGTGFSKPVATFDRNGENVAFVLSYGEAANFISTGYSDANGEVSPSPAIAQKNFGKLDMYHTYDWKCDSMWLRSPGAVSDRESTMAWDGRIYQRYVNGEHSEAALAYPALWVHSSIFDE